MHRIASRWLPPPRTTHPYLSVRFAATHPREEPSAVVRHVGICAGGARKGGPYRDPCWSWESARDLWAGKYGTTGHGGLIISGEFGNIIFVSDPAPGCNHDMRKLEGEVKEILDLAGSVVADKSL